VHFLPIYFSVMSARKMFVFSWPIFFFAQYSNIFLLIGLVCIFFNFKGKFKNITSTFQ
jgi:hypothetical protein